MQWTMSCLTLLLLAVATAFAAEPAKAKNAKKADVDRGVALVQKIGDSRSRIALVIGNSHYATSPLKNPVNDAKAMAATLRRLGFEVEEKTDLGFVQMNKAVESFGKKLKPGGVGLFYYAGHAIQVGGANYLIPVDAEIEDENEVRYKSVDAGLVLAKMEQSRGDVNIVILDACRNNPFARSFRSATRGLASMDAPSGSLIAYATAPGRTAADGDGKNGIYTEELIRLMETPGLTVEEAFKRVRRAVMERTASAQVPWEASSLTGDFHFIPPTELVDKQPTPPQTAPQQTTPRGFTDPLTGMEFVPVSRHLPGTGEAGIHPECRLLRPLPAGRRHPDHRAGPRRPGEGAFYPPPVSAGRELLSGQDADSIGLCPAGQHRHILGVPESWCQACGEVPPLANAR